MRKEIGNGASMLAPRFGIEHDGKNFEKVIALH
jgi:hypothetical protein